MRPVKTVNHVVDRLLSRLVTAGSAAAICEEEVYWGSCFPGMACGNVYTRYKYHVDRSCKHNWIAIACCG